MKKLLFVAITALFLLGNIYVFYSIFPIVTGLQIEFKVLFYTIALVMIVAMFVFFGIGKAMPIYIASLFYKIGTGWLMLLIYATLIALGVDAVSYLNLHFIHQPIAVLEPHSRAQGLLVLGSICFVALVGFVNYSAKKRVALTLKTDKALRKSIKIVFISDLHLGYAIGVKELTEWVAKINKEEADLVLIGGDIIDYSLLPVAYYKMGDLFQQIKSTYGVYACMGNHDYMAGAEASIKFMRDNGINLLRDQSITIEDLNVTIIGRDDKTNTSRKPLANVKATCLDTNLLILLDHQPFNLNEAVENKIDIQLSGHTHRGQVWPISYITDFLFEKSHGYLQKGNTNFYVSSGIGIWGGRYRIGTQSEYLVLKVEK